MGSNTDLTYLAPTKPVGFTVHESYWTMHLITELILVKLYRPSYAGINRTLVQSNLLGQPSASFSPSLPAVETQNNSALQQYLLFPTK